MMSFNPMALVILGTLIGLICVRFVYRHVCGFSSRMPNDVFPFLLKVDMEALYGTFHPDPEQQFKEKLAPREFRHIQWKRIHLAIHYCNQISNNAHVFLSWTRHERKQIWLSDQPAVRKTVQQLRVACLHSTFSAFMIRSRLRLWLVRMALLPFLDPPSFATLLRHGSWDMISFYERVRGLAELVSISYGDEYHEKLMQAL